MKAHYEDALECTMSYSEQLTVEKDTSDFFIKEKKDRHFDEREAARVKSRKQL